MSGAASYSRLMADRISKAARSRNMAAIRSKDTKPELRVRSFLHKAGFRFRIHRKDLPGTPDIVLPKYRTVIFVHGCFWHCHPGCSLAATPKSNEKFWRNKLEGNVERDKRNIRELEDAGWRVLIVWECETKSEEFLSSLIRTITG